MKALFLATMILLQSCSNKAATTSRLQDLPLDQQSPLVQTLAGLSSEELDELFQSGQALDFASIPTRIVGYHRIDERSLAQPPALHEALVKSFIWRAKIFKDINTDMPYMVDDTIFSDQHEPLKANVTRGSASHIFEQRYDLDKPWFNDAIDSKTSLITAYYSWEYKGVLKPIMKPFRGWFDEYRMVEFDGTSAIIARSYYEGRFWAHILFDPSL